MQLLQLKSESHSSQMVLPVWYGIKIQVWVISKKFMLLHAVAPKNISMLTGWVGWLLVPLPSILLSQRRYKHVDLKTTGELLIFAK